MRVRRKPKIRKGESENAMAFLYAPTQAESKQIIEAQFNLQTPSQPNNEEPESEIHF